MSSRTSEPPRDRHQKSVVVHLRRFLLLIAFCTGCGGQQVDVTAEYKDYFSRDGTFRCVYPATWKVDGGGKPNSWAKFTSGSALLRLYTDTAGSLIGDFSGGVTVDVDEVVFSPAVEVHPNGVTRLEEVFPNFAESDEEPEIFSCSLGAACRTKFTASSAFGTSITGYRATILAKNKRVIAICACAGKDWEAVSPVFEKMLASLARGKQQR